VDNTEGASGLADARLAEAIRKAIAEHQIVHAEMVILDSKNKYIAGVRIDAGGGKNAALWI
jgi:hypothetical protein